jgi:cutinase
MMNAISTLPDNVRSKIVGVVLFGYTKNGQTKGTIPNYPNENLKVFCTKGDGVCWGQLNVSAGHFAYIGTFLSFYHSKFILETKLMSCDIANGDGPAATKFLLEKIAAGPQAAKSGGGSSAAPAEEAHSSMAKGKGMPKGKGKGNFVDDMESLRMTRGMMSVRRRI